MAEVKEKYITLKEAARISGYAPDYIGQLIRAGKIPGKQVYHNVAWMTTEETLRHYMQKSQSKKENLSLGEKISDGFQQIRARLLLELELAKLVKTVLYVIIILSVGFSLVLFYIISVSIDKKLEQKAIRKIEVLQSEL